MRRINRRIFLKHGAIGLLAIGLPPRFLARTLLAGTGRSDRQRTVVFIFQRGAVDGLSMVVPFDEKAYYRVRRSIAIPQPSRASAWWSTIAVLAAISSSAWSNPSSAAL